jgi:tetratricopeptide (TPR) repeat protein
MRMKKQLYLLILLSFMLINDNLFSQTKELNEEASTYFDAKNYKKAYDLYDQLYTKSPKNFEYKSRLGFCALYYPEKKARAIEIFEDIKRTDNSPEADYYLAKAYHTNYKFDKAIASYESYINSKGQKIKEDDKPLVEDSKLGIINCNNGKELMSNKITADIKNIGAPINTHETEGVPIISADESVLIYTYVGEKSTGGLLNDLLKPDAKNGTYHEDIFMATKLNDSTFNQPTGITTLNTLGNDAAVAISPDGQTLFTFVSDVKNPGDLYFSKYTGTEWSKPEKLNSNINSEYWEGSCSITSDGRYLYFASERPGGIGGRDIYISEKINGDWGPAKNLGTEINTPYNEDAPFIHPDGITLFFSSQGHKSIGGYDIMYTIKKENHWITPISLGIPLNTTEDDRYYVINAEGDIGYFSSNRGGAGGKGEQDIYTVSPGIPGEKPVLALLKGSVYYNEKPVEAKIEVIKVSTNEAIGPYYANSKTGKYLMAISPGDGYKVKITVAGAEPMEDIINVEKLQKFVEIRKDFYVYSPEFEPKRHQVSVNSILDSLFSIGTNAEAFNNDRKDIIDAAMKTLTTTATSSATPCNGGSIPDLSSIKGKSLNDASVYKKLIEVAGNLCIDGLEFKVQVAAYKHPENYSYSHLSTFGSPDKKDYPDGITRFTMQSFSTIKEADVARNKMIAKGQKDAWITAFINDKRFTLEELILVDFNGKAIN